MKFAEHLVAQQTPEWHAQYIQYGQMKKMIYDGREMVDQTDDQRRSSVLSDLERSFFEFCSQELDRVDRFLSLKQCEAYDQYCELCKDLKLAQKLEKLAADERRRARTTAKAALRLRLRFFDTSAGVKPPPTLSQLKELFSEYYLGLVLLQRYQHLNIAAFRKILQKHDRVFNSTAGAAWSDANLRSSSLFTKHDVEQLIAMTERTFTDSLENGDRHAAMKRLRVPPFRETHLPPTTFRTGFYIGGLTVLVFLTAIAIAQWFRSGQASWVPVRLFRGSFVLFLSVLLIGMNMYRWRRYGVNHVLIFELDPRRHLSYQELIEIGCMFFVVWFLCVLGCLHAPAIGVSPWLFPLILMTFLVGWMLNPLNMCQRRSRYWLLQQLWRCFTAPLHTVTFADFWLADQMNSLVTLFLDYSYFFCFYGYQADRSHDWLSRLSRVRGQSAGNRTVTGQSPSSSRSDSSGDEVGICSSNVYGSRPMMAALPALVRMLQCLRRYYDTQLVFPHLINAGKYSTTLFVVLFGALDWSYSHGMEEANGVLFYLWLTANVVSLLYTYAWDIKMDWGLLDRNCGRNRYLREHLVYHQKWFYYSAMVADFFLRITWVLNVSVGETWLTKADIVLTVTAPLECFRRFLWNYFRLENEHLNNCGQFRAVRDISLQPFSKLDIQKLEEMTDEDTVYDSSRSPVLRPITNGSKIVGQVRRPVLERDVISGSMVRASPVDSHCPPVSDLNSKNKSTKRMTNAGTSTDTQPLETGV